MPSISTRSSINKTRIDHNPGYFYQPRLKYLTNLLSAIKVFDFPAAEVVVSGKYLDLP